MPMKIKANAMKNIQVAIEKLETVPKPVGLTGTVLARHSVQCQ
jgi:hypothetical protein